MASQSQQRLYPLMVDSRRAGASQVLIKTELADEHSLSRLLATNTSVQQNMTRSRSVPPAFRQRDSTARVALSTAVKKTAEEELQGAPPPTFSPAARAPPLTPRSHPPPSTMCADLERRLTYLHERQAVYDDYAARPRNVRRPDSRLERAAFARRLEDVLGPSEVKDDAQTKVDVYEAMVAQKAQQRHFEWTKRVFEPITHAIGSAVDVKIEAITSTRRQAYNDYLRATSTRNGVFLDDTTSDYDPYSVTRGSIRVSVPVQAVDPMKVLLTKERGERAILDPEAARQTRRARARETLAPQHFTAQAMESTMHGHFEIRDAAVAAAGGRAGAWAGKDTEGSLRYCGGADDFNAQPLTATGKGRYAELDAEFPLGRRVVGYPYRSQQTGAYLKHQSMTGVYEAGDGVFTDDAPLSKDVVRSSIAKQHVEAMPHQPSAWAKVERLRREVEFRRDDYKYR